MKVAFRARPGRRSRRLSRFAVPATPAPPTRVSTAPRARAPPARRAVDERADTRPVIGQPEDLHRPGRELAVGPGGQVSPQPLALGRRPGRPARPGACPEGSHRRTQSAGCRGGARPPGQGRALEQGHRLAPVVGAVPQPAPPGGVSRGRRRARTGGDPRGGSCGKGADGHRRPTWSPGPERGVASASRPYCPAPPANCSSRPNATLAWPIGISACFDRGQLLGLVGVLAGRRHDRLLGVVPSLPSAPPAPRRCPQRRGHRQGGSGRGLGRALQRCGPSRDRRSRLPPSPRYVVGRIAGSAHRCAGPRAAEARAGGRCPPPS